MRTALALFFAASALAQNPNTAVFPSAVVTDSDLLVVKSLGRTTLVYPVTPSATSIVFASATLFTTPVAVTIDDEVLRCASHVGATYTCTRGFAGSRASTHAALATIRGEAIDWHHNQMAAEVKAIERKLASEYKSVVDYGADPTGVRDSLAAFNAAHTASNTIRVPAGTYTFSGEFLFDRSNTALLCEGTGSNSTNGARNAVLQYVGTGTIRSVVHMTAYGGGKQRIENCRIAGNTHSTYALYAENTNGTQFINLEVDGGVLASFYHDVNVATSIYDLESHNRPPNIAAKALLINRSNSVLITSPNVDSSNISVGLSTCSTSNPGLSPAITVMGGTFEQNSTNVENCEGSQIYMYGMDNEKDPTHITDKGLVDAGQTIIEGGIFGGTLRYTPTSYHSRIERTLVDQITVDAGARGTEIRQTLFANNFGTITDNGTCTYLEGNSSANGNNFFPDRIGCAGIILASGVNVVRETDGSADDAIIGNYAPRRSGDKVTPYMPNIPLQDGMLFNIRLSHALTGGAATFKFANNTAHPIKKATAPRANSAARVAGAYVLYRWADDDGVFVDLGQ